MSELGISNNEVFMPQEIVVDEGTSLRFLMPEDADRVYQIFEADPEIQRRVTWTHGLQGVEEVRDAILNFQKTRSIRYAIVSDGAIAGYVGMWSDHGYMDGEDHKGWFGFGYFLDPSYRGKGLVKRATEAMMTKAESVFDVCKWSVYVEDDNESSRAVLSKLGFVATDHIFDEPVMHVQERQWEKIIHE